MLRTEDFAVHKFLPRALFAAQHPNVLLRRSAQPSILLSLIERNRN